MTNPMRIVHRLYRASVWGPDGVSPEDFRFRGLFRWVLPLLDLAFIWFGVAGWYAGISTVEAATSHTWQEYWSAGIAVAATVALIGVSFPRLWFVEVLGKAPLVGLVMVYLVLFLTRSTTNSLLWATAGLYFTFALLPTWRLGDLGYVWWNKRVEREKARITETGEVHL